MIDTGATASFLNFAYAKKHQLPLLELDEPRKLTYAHQGKSSYLTHFVEVDFRLGQHHEKLRCYVASSLAYPVILGTPWLKKHHVLPDVLSGSVSFNPGHCGSCLPTRSPCTVYSCAGAYHPKPVEVEGHLCSVASLSELCDDIMEDGTECYVLWPKGAPDGPDEDLEPHALGVSSLSCSAVNPEDLDKFLKGKPVTDPRDKVPSCYHSKLHMFSKPASDQLPPQRPGLDHKIHLTE